MKKSGIASLMGNGSMFEMHRSMQSIRDAIMPPHVRVMMEMQESLRALRRPDILGVPLIDTMHTSIAPPRLTASMDAVSQIMRGQEILSSIRSAELVTEQLRSALGPQLAWSAMPSLRLANSLTTFASVHSQVRWHEHLVKSISPAFDLFANWNVGSIGLLAFLPEPEAGASVSWLVDDAARPSIAALLADAERLPKIVVETVVLCAFCDCELMTQDQSFRWKGNRLRNDVRVFPICSACLAEAGDYAEFILDKLREQLRPSLKLVRTSGTSDGVPRAKGKLRLVKPDEEDTLDSNALDGDDEQVDFE